MGKVELRATGKTQLEAFEKLVKAVKIYTNYKFNMQQVFYQNTPTGGYIAFVYGELQ